MFRKQTGFTLLEVLIALSILGVIGVGLLTALNTNARATRILNEVIVEPFASIDSIFQPPDMTVTRDDFNSSSYSWNTDVVMVPAYDSRTDADGLIIDANMALILGGISITSWQIY